ncbi:MAG: hypothetical protein K0A95_08240 [Chromatiales bacterium]|nr:hypothetical protein [Chromatiales bacterium]
MFRWLQAKPLLDEATRQWLFDLYAWALRHFDAEVFYTHTPLVAPNGQFFPGRADNPQAMAELILGHVQRHAALGHWPCRAVDYRQCSTQPAARLLIDGALRQPGAEPGQHIAEEQALLLQYDPAMLNNPEAMIASYAHTLAHYLASLAPEPPPGGEQNWPHATEVLAVFLGFGVIMANSTGNVRIPRCGSCAPPPVDRQAWLSQYDISYALAIFCVLKGIPVKQASAQLKPALRPWFKRAYREIRRDPRLGGLTGSPDR